MSTPPAAATPAPNAGNDQYYLRWRGQQEGPFTLAVIEGKLASHRIGLLHEILLDGQWVTVRDFFAARTAALAREAEALRQQQEDEKERTRAAERQALLLAEQAAQRPPPPAVKPEILRGPVILPASVKPHRGGAILALGVIGLIICGPLCLAAWLMGGSDLHEMDAGLMDPSGRSTTAVGRTLGVVGTLLWIIATIILLVR